MIVYEAAGQFYVFLSCVFLGAVLGVLWRLTHLSFRRREAMQSAERQDKPENLKVRKAIIRRLRLFKASVAAGDVLFCALALPVVFFGLLWICYGSLRLYCFAGILTGFFLWRSTTGLVVDNFVNRMYNKIQEKILSRKIGKENGGKQNG